MSYVQPSIFEGGPDRLIGGDLFDDMVPYSPEWRLIGGKNRILGWHRTKEDVVSHGGVLTVCGRYGYVVQQDWEPKRIHGCKECKEK